MHSCAEPQPSALEGDDGTYHEKSPLRIYQRRGHQFKSLQITYKAKVNYLGYSEIFQLLEAVTAMKKTDTPIFRGER